jgi:hypothetical protein
MSDSSSTISTILCDGCGQPASPEHLAQRLLRLEWATRYRPIHLHSLLLGAVAPASRAQYLYSPDGTHTGEAVHVLAAADVTGTGKNADAVHAEFQRRGLFLTHVLECPLENNSSAGLVESRLPLLFTRIRRSLKPKRLVLISEELAPLIDKFTEASLGCELVLDHGKPFALDAADVGAVAETGKRLHEVLAVPVSR